MLLEARHLDTQNGLGLGGQLLDDILLETTEHKSLELRVEGLDLGLLLRIAELEVIGELELIRLDEV